MSLSSHHYSFFEIFEQSYLIYKKYFKEIIILTLIIYSLSSSVSLILGLTSSFVFNLFTIIFIAYLFKIFQLHEDKQSIDLDQILFRKNYHRQLTKTIYPFLLLTIFLILLSFALIIPAIIFGVYWSFWELIALEKNLKPKEILESSKKLVSGNWWYLFIYLIITIFISNLPFSFTESFLPINPLTLILSTIVSGLINSFFIIGFFIIYRNLQKFHH